MPDSNALDLVREDGLIERKARWSDIGVGSVVLAAGRKWTVIASAIPQQFGYGRSLWFQMQAPKGETVNYPPQPLKRTVTLLIDPEAPPVEPALPEGAAEAALLVEKLGATEIAVQDKATGEVWCENFHELQPGHGVGQLHHLRVAHGVDTRGLEAMDALDAITERVLLHGQLHEGRLPTTGGFPHRHVPEDLTIT